MDRVGLRRVALGGTVGVIPNTAFMDSGRGGGAGVFCNAYSLSNRGKRSGQRHGVLAGTSKAHGSSFTFSRQTLQLDYIARDDADSPPGNDTTIFVVETTVVTYTLWKGIVRKTFEIIQHLQSRQHRIAFVFNLSRRHSPCLFLIS